MSPYRKDSATRISGVLVPADQVEAHLLAGWTIAVIFIGEDLVLMREPEEIAA